MRRRMPLNIHLKMPLKIHYDFWGVDFWCAIVCPCRQGEDKRVFHRRATTNPTCCHVCVWKCSHVASVCHTLPTFPHECWLWLFYKGATDTIRVAVRFVTMLCQHAHVATNTVHFATNTIHVFQGYHTFGHETWSWKIVALLGWPRFSWPHQEAVNRRAAPMLNPARVDKPCVDGSLSSCCTARIDPASETQTPFAKTLALQSNGGNCSPAPDSLLWKLMSQGSEFSGDVLFHGHRHVGRNYVATVAVVTVCWSYERYDWNLSWTAPNYNWIK